MPLCSTSIRSELSEEHFFRFVSLIHGFAVQNPVHSARIERALPSRHHEGSDRVADEIRQRTRPAHDRIDSQEKPEAGDR